jgi:hypothetical protein
MRKGTQHLEPSFLFFIITLGVEVDFIEKLIKNIKIKKRP